MDILRSQPKPAKRREIEGLNAGRICGHPPWTLWSVHGPRNLTPTPLPSTALGRSGRWLQNWHIGSPHRRSSHLRQRGQKLASDSKQYSEACPHRLQRLRRSENPVGLGGSFADMTAIIRSNGSASSSSPYMRHKIRSASAPPGRVGGVLGSGPCQLERDDAHEHRLWSLA
jgi:hypothetical protein